MMDPILEFIVECEASMIVSFYHLVSNKLSAHLTISQIRFSGVIFDGKYQQAMVWPLNADGLINWKK